MMISPSSGISVVIPTFNESAFIAQTILECKKSLEESGAPHQIIVVDDGSTDETRSLLTKLGEDLPLDIVMVDHAGRIAARLAGAHASKFENILMLDSRVRLKPKSITNLLELINKNPQSKYWNGDIEFEHLNLPQVSMWQTLVAAGWKEYVLNPRVVNFNLSNFDKYPKGTGLFLAPKSEWIVELENINLEQLQSARPISDDTRILRNFASRGDIWISPEFKGRYQPRTEFKKFLTNAFYRGSTFVDSYWDSKTLVGKVVRWATPILVLAIVVTAGVSPRVLIDGLLLALVAAAMMFGIFSMRAWADAMRAIKESIIFLLFLPIFALGYLRGFVGKMASKAIH